jgi:hypothetical protein
MKEEFTTISNEKPKDLTIEDVKKMADKITKMSEKPLPKGIGWFTKLMANFGWHRKYELIVINENSLSKGLRALISNKER